MLIDMDGNTLKNVHQTDELKEEAIRALHNEVSKIQKMIEKHLRKIQNLGHFDSLSDALGVPVSEFIERCEQIHTIIDTGYLYSTDILGIDHEEDYQDMRKDLLVEMMYYIDNIKKTK